MSDTDVLMKAPPRNIDNLKLVNRRKRGLRISALLPVALIFVGFVCSMAGLKIWLEVFLAIGLAVFFFGSPIWLMFWELGRRERKLLRTGVAIPAKVSRVDGTHSVAVAALTARNNATIHHCIVLFLFNSLCMEVAVETAANVQPDQDVMVLLSTERTAVVFDDRLEFCANPPTRSL